MGGASKSGGGTTLMALVLFTVVLLGAGVPQTLLPNKNRFRGAGSQFKVVRAATWNIAAINNNPFEYWITWENENYVKLMQSVSAAMTNPGSLDVPVKEVFSDEMFSDLCNEMVGAGFAGVDAVKAMWGDYKERKIITGFLKDSVLGKKRLASMPDRTTNTIQQADGSAVYRPTVINCYAGDLSSQAQWWAEWKKFIFKTSVSVAGKPEQPVHKLVLPITHAKYPDITEEEEKVSIPLSTMCAAIFDATLVHLLNSFKATPWQPIRSEMCEKLVRKKDMRTLEILDKKYKYIDVMFLQEVGKGFIEQFKKSSGFSAAYTLHLGADANPNRDQNSLILLKRGQFAFVKDVSVEVLALAAGGKKAPVAKGDLLVIRAKRELDGAKFLLASFHGDTNGLATIPVLELVLKYAKEKAGDHKLLFGMDANSYAKGKSDQLDVTEFGQFFSQQGLNSCYGKSPNPLDFTTFHARTYLQPQLNKAVDYSEKDVKGDKNPKDFILFFDSDFRVQQTKKDNTGEHSYTEGMVFPTLSFPSDHGITSTVVIDKKPKKA